MDLTEYALIETQRKSEPEHLELMARSISRRSRNMDVMARSI